jgi:tetratricopeptide (TPR) repeat protein
VRRIGIVKISSTLVLPLALLFPVVLPAQVGSSVSKSSSEPQSSSSAKPGTSQVQDEPATAVPRPRAAQIEKGGSAVTLETSEPLFQVTAALNACGYDADLDKSPPVRAAVRTDMTAALAGSEEARVSRDKICEYITEHRLNDTGLEIGQYVSLALYLSPPPELTPNVDETQLPPQAAAVVNMLPLLRDFAEKVDLHFIWLKHRAEYEALTARVHDPMTQMILDTNIYLHQPVSTYDGRRFLVLLEPMLSPNLTNARVYGTDYIIITSPDKSAGDPVRMDLIRHIYLHYVVEPMVYSRGSAMERIQPMLRGVQDAPLEFFYKSDVVALMTECLIKAIEARTFVIAEEKPKKPNAARTRTELDQYTQAIAIYDRETSLARERLVTTDEQQGWTMTGYFYRGLMAMEHNGDGLRDEIAPMIYGMDVDREKKHAQETVFVKSVPSDPLRPTRAARQLEGMDLAEVDLLKGDINGAADLAEKALAQPDADHGRATYVLARIELMQGDPEKAQQGFTKALTLSKDPRTLAWSHIYLGRLYDIESTPERAKAVAEYRAALEVRDGRPDTRLAAEAGVKQRYQLPQRAGSRPAATHAEPADDDDKDFDPTGKAEKDAYKPDAPKQ